MNRIFIETPEFMRDVEKYLSTDDISRLQFELQLDPHRGEVIPGCEGLRKVRFGQVAKGKGKRGGVRVLYLDLPRSETIYLLLAYEKTARENFSPEERKKLRDIVRSIKKVREKEPDE